jgi:hypothetical protein
MSSRSRRRGSGRSTTRRHPGSARAGLELTSSRPGAIGVGCRSPESRPDRTTAAATTPGIPRGRRPLVHAHMQTPLIKPQLPSLPLLPPLSILQDASGFEFRERTYRGICERIAPSPSMPSNRNFQDFFEIVHRPGAVRVRRERLGGMCEGRRPGAPRAGRRSRVNTRPFSGGSAGVGAVGRARSDRTRAGARRAFRIGLSDAEPQHPMNRNGAKP